MIINGRLISEDIKEKIKKETAYLRAKGIITGLAVIMVGNDSASQIYVRNKKIACEEAGISSKEYCLPENISDQDLISLIKKLNDDCSVNGILVQLPLPSQISEKKVAENIVPEKDVDVFNPVNLGKLMRGDDCLLPCTPAGIIEILKHEKIEISGKNCVVVGRSNIVGKPLALLFLREDATVTVCHSKTQNLNRICKEADILVSAVGKPNFITPDMVKKGAVVIDVGINRLPCKKVCGDVNFEKVFPVASRITPVPGGVGPLTIAMLLKNTVTAAKFQNKDILTKENS